jgi:hypothetical protein
MPAQPLNAGRGVVVPVESGPLGQRDLVVVGLACVDGSLVDRGVR